MCFKTVSVLFSFDKSIFITLTKYARRTKISLTKSDLREYAKRQCRTIQLFPVHAQLINAHNRQETEHNRK